MMKKIIYFLFLFPLLNSCDNSADRIIAQQEKIDSLKNKIHELSISDSLKNIQIAEYKNQFDSIALAIYYMKANPNTEFKGWTNTNRISEGDGNVYTVNPGANGGPGGYGKGISYNLTGRKMIKEPSLKNNSNESGIVVVKIKVNKQGKVISVDGPAQGSTTTSTYLLNLAKQASMAAQFDLNSSSMDEQFGAITYNFKAK
ncbi:MAG: hypothetical protein D4R43_03195 [Sphingobacteriales bacterium]|nr:MAG: hypothetical protein D4R43_03195 [Sphingobacteriales bacterium]